MCSFNDRVEGGETSLITYGMVLIKKQYKIEKFKHFFLLALYNIYLNNVKKI